MSHFNTSLYRKQISTEADVSVHVPRIGRLTFFFKKTSTRAFDGLVYRKNKQTKISAGLAYRSVFPTVD